MTKKEAAIAYAANGWKVFPCSPNTKIPIAGTHGVRDATSDVSAVAEWWTNTPDANIGLACGAASGVYVVDIDIHADKGVNGFDSVRASGKTLPDTLKQRTPSGGMHLLYKCEGERPANKNGYLRGVDIRGDGYYIVVAPSSIDGRQYEWVDVNAKPTEYPEDFKPTKSIAVNSVFTAIPPACTAHSTPAIDRARAYLDKIPGAVEGAGGHNTLYWVAQVLVNGFRLSDSEAEELMWSEFNPRCVPPWPRNPSTEKEFRHKISDAHAKPNAEACSIYDAVGDYDAVEEFDFDKCIADVRALLAPKVTTQATARTITKSEAQLNDLLRPDGLVGDIASWMNETAGCYQPLFSLGAALTLCGAIFGRKVCDESNGRTNIFCMGVGHSSSGKDHPGDCINKILTAAGAQSVLMGRMTSDSAIEKALSISPTKLAVMDEVGHFFSNINKAGEGASYLKTIKPTLMELFSSAHKTYIGKEKASGNPPIIEQPCMCLWGVTAPQKLYSGMTIEELQDGWIARNLIFISETRPEYVMKPSSDVPASIVATVSAWINRSMNTASVISASPGIVQKPFVVPMDQNARVIFDRYSHKAHEAMIKAHDRGDKTEYLWGKAFQNARRIALIIACGREYEGPVIGKYEAEYGCNLVDQEALSDFRVANDKTVRKGYDPDVRQSRKESEIRSDIELVGSDNISEVAKKRDIMMMYAGDPRWQPKIDAANRLVKDYIDERWRRTVGYRRGDKDAVKEAVDLIKRIAPDVKVKTVDSTNSRSYADYDVATNTIKIYGDAGIRDVMHDVGWHVMRRWAERNSPEMLAKLNEYAESAPAYIREYVDRVYADFKGDNNAFLDELGAIRWERQFSGDLAEALRDRNNRSWLKKFGDAVKDLYVDAARKMGIDVGNIDVENALKTMNANEFVDFMASEVVKGHRLSNGIRERVNDGARTVEASPAADGEPVVEVDGKRYSYKSMRHDLDEGHMVDELIRTKVFADKKEAKKWVSKVNKLMDAIEPRLDILDMNETVGREDREFSPYKDNSDPLYTLSLDFSTLCKKRIFTQKVIDKLQSEVKRDFLTRDEQIAVRDMLKEYQKIDKDLQVACHLCYVEAARLKAPEQQLRLFNEPGELRGEFVNYMALKHASELGKEFQRRWKIEHGYPEDATKAEIDRLAKERGTPKSKVMNDETSAYRKANYKLSAEEEAIFSRLEKMGKAPFLDSAKLTKLASTEPEIYDFYTTVIRNATKSKGLEPDVPYYFGDSRARTLDGKIVYENVKGSSAIVSDGFIKKMNAQGTGLRHQSWSDFQVTHLLDTVTALADLATRGAKMHCYTKVPEFVEIFGKSGIMYNLSLIPEMKDGKWGFSPVEGMDYGTAMKLRRKFTDTVGTIAIAADYGHLRQLLKNASIDYVIPYHSSGMPGSVRNMAGIGKWTDFQDIQHTTENKSIKAPDKKPANWHKEPVLSEWVVDEGKGGLVTMQDSAKRYVDLCNERGMRPKFAEVDGLMKKNADGTYTLLDKNYWKLLVDHKMIDGKNRLIEQKPVRPEFDLAAAKKAIAKEIGTYDESRFDRAYDYVRKQYDTIDERIANLKDSGKIDKIIEGIKKAKRHSMKDDGPDDPNDDGPGGGKRLINKDGKGIIQPYGNSISERGRFIEDGGKIYPTTVNRSEESRVLSSEDVFGREYKKSVTPEFRIEEDVVYDSEKFQKVYNSLNGDLQSKKIADRVFELGSRLGLKYTIGDIDGGLDGVEISGGHIMYDINGLTDWRYTPQDKANTILHEAIHGITTYAINIAEGSAKAPKGVDVNGKLKKAVKELNDVFKRSLQYTNGFQNGRSNASEFIAELANPAFRNRLKKASIFTSVVNAIKNIFKAISGKFNLNDEALANLDKFIDNVDEFAFDAQRHYSRVKNSKAGIDNLFYPEKSIVRHSKKDTESEGGIALDWTKEAESFGEKARRNMQDHMLPVSRMEKKLGITDKEESFYHAKDRAFGRNDHEMRVLEKSVVKPMLSEISKAGVSYGRVWDSSNPNSKVGLDDYLYAMHAKERNAVLNNRDGNAVDGSGMSDATADAILNSFAKMPAAERKVIEDAAKAVWKMNDEGLTRRVDSGRMSQAEADALRRQFKHYVPLRTNMEADGNDLFNNGTAGFGKHEFHKALGRTSEADSPLVFSLMQAKDSILGSNKNMARGKLLDIVQNHDGLADVWRFDKASNHWLKIERDPSGNDIVVDKKSARFFSPNEADMNDIVLAKKNGDLYAMQFYNEQGNLIARAATDKGVMNFNSKFEFVQQLTRKMAEMRTQLVPTFTIRNLVTDHNEAFLNAIGDRGIIGAAKFFGRMEKYFWDREAYKAKKLYFNDGKFNDGPSATETDKLFKEYVTNGGLIGGGRRMGYGEQAAEFDDIINSAKRGVINPKRILGKLGDVMTTLNEQVEVGTRFAVYRACRAEGMSVADAVSYSRDLTTNFNRKGEYTPVTNSLYMFSNAAIQGLARALKSVNVKGPNAAKAWEAIAFMTVLGSAQALWAHFMNDDEDRKRKGESVASYTSEHNKQNSAEFGYNGMTVHGKIRYPWAVPMYTARKITELFLGDTNVKDAVDNLGDGVIVSMLQEPVGHGGTAFQTVLPSILVPAGQIVEGKDFRGQDLYRKNYVEEMPDSENGRKATGSFYKSVAKGINSATGGNQGRKGYVDVAPETIKVIAETLGGGIMTDTAKVLNLFSRIKDTIVDDDVQVSFRDIPFVADVFRENAPVDGKYYETLNKVTADKYEYKTLSGKDRNRFLAKNRHVENARMKALEGEIKDLSHREDGEVKDGTKYKPANLSYSVKKMAGEMKRRKMAEYIKLYEKLAR